MHRAVAIAAALLALAPAAQASADAPNPAPEVVPALREWSGGSGTFELSAQSRIVVESRALAGAAEMLRDDLEAVSGLDVRVVDSALARAGDVVLARGSGLGREGYRLEIGDRVTIAGAEAGVFYGAQTVLEILRATPGHRTLPRGEARDWPRFRERGYLLDVGRKYWSPDFIAQTIREMAYLKLNTLHLHFTDHNAFRLVSDRFPYLAAPKAYTRADIRRFEEVARRHHVMLIPEIEMPSHASAILQAHPELGFECASIGNGTLPGTVRGAPYGTSPGYEPASTFAKAFDGDPITYFLYAEPSGGYAGLDLGAGRESTVGLIRFFATAGEHNLGRMIGGRFEGCADGPDAGCHTLATVDERPDFGWNELPVGDGGRYRWLRYVGPANGYSTVAEIEFVAPSSDVTVQAPTWLRRLGANEVVTTYRNTTGRTVRDLRLSLSAYATRDRAARAAQPAGRTRFEVVGPGRSVSARCARTSSAAGHSSSTRS